MTLEFARHADGADFLRHTETYLLRNEAENSLTLGVAAMNLPGDATRNLWASVSDGGELVATAFHTPPYNVVLTAAAGEAVDLLAAELHASGLNSPGVLGPSESAMRFAATWSGFTGVTVRPGLAQRIYRLDRVIPPASTAGDLRLAGPDDLYLLAEWLDAFIVETGIPNPQTGTQIAGSGIADGRIFVWDNGGPVSTALWNRPTRNGVTINAVYTPGNERARGYASACVAALSQRMLDEGRDFCCLYADQSNRTSNDIYMSIGYRPVCDVDEYRFG
ncbi:MAG: GNAT family N-acetyltransferase [Dehalococcoidia bacterium]|jgi:hypothetical protein|nr:GNAT family N-acetyltransferase [Dehalococcoidia bacterium]